MLRRTAARAFGSEATDREAVPPAPHETQRSAAMERLFRELHQALEAASTAQGEGGASPALKEEDGGWMASSGWIRVTKPRALADGIETTLEGPAAAYSFLNTLSGYIRVGRRSAGAVEPLELLSVARQGGSYRAIRKAVPPPASTWDRGGEGRCPFAFTSVAELAREYLDAAKSIHKIDTSRFIS